MITGVMSSSDGQWRVEVYTDGRRRPYRVYLHGGLVGECDNPEQVSEVMARLGGDYSELVER